MFQFCMLFHITPKEAREILSSSKDVAILTTVVNAMHTTGKRENVRNKFYADEGVAQVRF